jgi:hypothetical protein
VVPAAQEQALQEAAFQKTAAQEQTQLTAYESCFKNAIDYINQQCPNSNSVTLNNWDCSRKVQQSAYYQQHFTCKAPW